MGKIEAPKRIRAEDYPSEDRNLISRLSPTLNNFNEQVFNLINGNLDIGENLSQNIVDVTVKRDSNVATPASSLTTQIQVKTNLKRKVRGVQCINAVRLDSGTPNTPVSQPFITFTINTIDLITIQKVTGLQADSQYNLTLLLIT